MPSSSANNGAAAAATTGCRATNCACCFRFCEANAPKGTTSSEPPVGHARTVVIQVHIAHRLAGHRSVNATLAQVHEGPKPHPLFYSLSDVSRPFHKIGYALSLWRLRHA